jgi:amidase
MTEACELSAREARRLIGTKALSPVELFSSCAKRIERVNGAVNAFVTLCLDRAEEEAKAAEGAVMAGDPLGPLHGLPLGVKDLALTGGVRTTFASPRFQDFVPEEDERHIAACRAAGAIVVGKTNTPEFGAGANTVNKVFGATGNPFDLEKTVAGSSGGSAAALAVGMVPIATGSDMGGSLRNPAAFCGIAGFRPSPGAVPSELRLHGFSPLGVNGPMARDVADAALLFDAMSGHDPRDPLSGPLVPGEGGPVDLSAMHVAISEDLGFAPMSEEIRHTFRDAVARIEGVFGTVEHRDPDMAGADEAFEGARCLTYLAAHHDAYREDPDSYGPNLVANLEQAMAMSAADAARALKLQTEIYRRFQTFMSDVDVLICPAMSVTPFPHRQLYVDEIDGTKLRTYFHWMGIAYGITLTTNPAICIPCGRDPHGMPFGIQVVGKRFGDLRTLRIAAALEEHLRTIPDLARPVPDLAALDV